MHPVDDIEIPNPNPALSAILLSSQMRSIVRQSGEKAKARYVAIVAKRSGKLAASARVRTSIGGYKNDRWVATLTVGQGLLYGASHEFGHAQPRSSITGRFETNTGKRRRGVRTKKAQAAKDLTKVLRSLRSL